MQSRNSKLILCPFCFFDKIDSPFCLQNCFFLLVAHFAQILLSKFCQGLVLTRESEIMMTDRKSIYGVMYVLRVYPGYSELFLHFFPEILVLRDCENFKFSSGN